LGAGGGKPDSSTVANQTNAILYAVFTFCAWLSGTVVNVLKPKLSIMIGSLGYPLYIAGLWYFDRTGHKWFPLWAGAMLGMLCGILQTVGAYISFAYPEEKDKALVSDYIWCVGGEDLGLKNFQSQVYQYPVFSQGDRSFRWSFDCILRERASKYGNGGFQRCLHCLYRHSAVLPADSSHFHQAS
jgi:hypothetical protein